MQFLDRPAGANGNGAQTSNGEAAEAANGSAAAADQDGTIPF